MGDAKNQSGTGSLRRTPLHALHLELGAKMVPFAGYEMPVQYPAGVMQEHLHTRAAAGLFDVSHMGQILLHPTGSLEEAALALETLVPVSVAGLAEGRQRYGLFTNDTGGILDDLMIANMGSHLALVVNAANKEADAALLAQGLGSAARSQPLDRALLALQGPAAEAALARLVPGCAAMRFMDAREFSSDFGALTLTRSGYTGEDGFEISVDNAQAEPLARALLADDAVAPIGLGARDSLRLEAGLCLHGQDITPAITPAEANLGWAIQKVRRSGGTRAGGFPGAGRILDELDNGAARLRCGLLPEGRAPMRAGTPLFESEDAPNPCGEITSGGFAPSLGRPVSMGYLPSDLAVPGTPLFAGLRGKRLPVTTTALPFRAATYKR